MCGIEGFPLKREEYLAKTLPDIPCVLEENPQAY